MTTGAARSLVARPTLQLLVAALASTLVVLSVGGIAYQSLVSLMFVWALLAIGWNVIAGYAGQMSLSHALFFGAGAYVPVLLAVSPMHIPPLAGFPIAVAASIVAALLSGIPTFRLSGIYFALASLAFPLLCIPVFNASGYQEVLVPTAHNHAGLYLQFDNPVALTGVCAGAFLAGAALNVWIARSKCGELFRAVRDNPLAASTSGFDVRRLKLLAYVISALYATAAGFLYAALIPVITPESVFGVGVIVQTLAIVLLGGLGSVWGPAIAAAILIPSTQQLLESYGTAIPGVDQLVVGLLAICCVLFFKRGIAPSIARLVSRLVPRGTRLDAAAPDASPIVGAGESAGMRLACYLEELHKQRFANTTSTDRGSISLDGITKSFGGVRVLSQVSFRVNPGELVGIVGPNGAGKTTLFNVLSGLTRQDSGTLVMNGTGVRRATPADRAKAGLGRTFQTVKFFERRSLLDNVAIAALSWCDKSRALEVALRSISVCEIDRAPDTPVDQLTATELRRMELARAVAGASTCILLDEPLAGLGDEDCRHIIALAKGMAKAGATVLIIEHTLSVLVDAVPRMIVMDEGRIVEDGIPTTVLRSASVEEAYLGRRWEHESVEG